MHQYKNLTWILYFFLFFSLSSIAFADGINITNPEQGFFYTVGVLDLELDVAGVGYTDCWYNLNYTLETFPISCNPTGNSIVVVKDGLSNLSVYFNQSGTVYEDSVIFNVNRNLTTGKGFILLGLILFPFFIIFALFYFGSKFGNEHKPLKYFLYFSALAFVFVSHLINMYVIENFIHAGPLMEVFNTRVYGWLFIIILFYFFIYWTYNLFMYLQDNKRRKLDY